MNWLAKDLPSLVLLLMPGFAAAGVFYTLTAHPKASEFERVVQALIFTVILKPLTAMAQWLCLWVGRLVSLGVWSQNVETAVSLVFAVLLGVAFAWTANKDHLHRWARKKGLTANTSYPSEWYSAFSRMMVEERWVVLHFTDGRRLYGWPEEWPDEPSKGHFVIDQPEWLLESNQRAPLYRVERALIPATDVRIVEFLRHDKEVTAPPEELNRVESLLKQEQEREGESHGSESAPAGPESTGE